MSSTFSQGHLVRLQDEPPVWRFGDLRTRLEADVISGATNQMMAPALHVSGAYPTWTLSFDDGVGGPSEPDFDDLVMTVTAHPVP